MDHNLKRLVNTPELYKAFTDHILARIAKLQTTLEQVSSLEQVFKTQGEIQALRRLLMLREEVNSAG